MCTVCGATASNLLSLANPLIDEAIQSLTGSGMEQQEEIPMQPLSNSDMTENLEKLEKKLLENH